MVQQYERKSILTTQGEPLIFKAIPSVPCFELWITIHFERIERNIDIKALTKKLKEHLPNYQKNLSDLYEQTRPYLESAMINAENLRKKFELNGVDPYTIVDALVKAIMQIKE